jgi:serine/threonine protein kinase
MAPEVIRKDPYGREVDIWSLGVTCYIVLGGYPPFSGEPLEALFSIIKKGEYEFHEDFWGSVSPEAKDFIKSMLCMDQKTRWTAKQLLKHPWLLSPSDTEVTSA